MRATFRRAEVAASPHSGRTYARLRTSGVVAAVAITLVAGGCTATVVTTPAAPEYPVTTPTPPHGPAAVDPGVPASDGRPMLWPMMHSEVVRDGSAWGSEQEFYGFVNAAGKLVIPERYQMFSYCTADEDDQNARPTLLMADREGKPTEVYSLTGKRLRHLPGELDCEELGRTVVTHTSGGTRSQSLVDQETGKVLVPAAPGREITALGDGVRFNVSDPSGEAFWNVETGKRTPHPGWLVDHTCLHSDAAPVYFARGGATRSAADKGRLGFLDLSGRWALEPTFEDWVDDESGGPTRVRLGATWSFLDEDTLQTTGGSWDKIVRVYLYTDLDDVDSDTGSDYDFGYLVTREHQQGLLDDDLNVLAEPGSTPISCKHHDCQLPASWSPSPSPSPSGPSGFTVELNQGFLADVAPGTDSDDPMEAISTRLFARGTGTIIVLPGPEHCTDVGDWVSCELPDPGRIEDTSGGMYPPVVFDPSGQMTSFSSIEYLSSPNGDTLDQNTYYWATSGPWRGIIDDSGTWRFRESRYSDLDD